MTNQTSSTSNEPIRELGPAAPLDVEQHVRSVVEQLTGPDRPASMNAMKTLERSEVFWTNVEPAKRELILRVLRDCALTDDDCVTTLGGMIDAYAEARLFRMTMFMRLTEGENPGPITAKGKTKALYRAYLAALDRETKLAQIIGLERRTKPVQSVAEIMGAHDEKGGHG